MSPLGKSLPDSSQESPVCGDFSRAGLVHEFSVMFLRERKEGGEEGDTANTQKVRRREKQVRDLARQTDRPGLGDRIFRFWVSVVTLSL